MKRTIKSLSVLWLSMSLTSCDKEINDPIVYQNEAVESYVLGNYQESLLSLKTGLKIDPANREMRKLLGEVWLKLGDPNACVEQLHKAKELGMSVNDLMIPLARCYQYQGYHDKVLALNYTGNLHAVSNQDIAELLAIKSQSSLALNDSDTSLDYLDKAMNLSPDMPEVTLAKAYWLAANQEMDQAFLVLDNLNKENPKFARAWGLLGDLYRNQNELDLAEDAYSQAILYADNQLDLMNYYLYRALVRTYKKSYEQARDDVNKATLVQKNNLRALYVQGMIDLAQQRYPEAIQAFQSVISNQDSFAFAHYFLGLSYTLTKNLHSARDHLAKFINTHHNHAYGHKLLALVEIQLGEYPQAIDRLEKLIGKTPEDAQSFHLLGEACLRNGEIERGSKYLKKALELDPNRADTQYQVGIASLELNDVSTARWAFGKVLEQFPQYKKALLLKFINEYKAKHFELAMNLANAYVKYYPNQPLGYNLQALVYQAQDKENQAQTIYKDVLALDKHDPNANTQLANLAMKDGQVKQAENYLESILVKWPHVPTMLKLARLHIQQGSLAKGIAYLQKAIESNPNDITAHLVLTRIYLENNAHDKAVNQMMLMPSHLHQHPSYSALQGLVYLAQKDAQQAEKIYKMLSTLEKFDTTTLEFLGEYAKSQQDYTAYEKWADKLLEQRARGRWVRWKADAQWSQQKPEQALETLKNWIEKNPLDHKAQLWYANYLMRQYQYGLAKNVYKHLLKYQPENPIIYNNLAWILKDTQPQEALRYVNQALKIQPNWSNALDTKRQIEAKLNEQKNSSS